MAAMIKFLDAKDGGRELSMGDIPPSLLEACEVHASKWNLDNGVLRRLVRLKTLKTKDGKVTRKAQVLTPLALPPNSSFEEKDL